mgnify:FL=1|jgi:hypothetical protein
MSAAQPAPGAVMGIEQIVRFADLWRSIVPPEAAGLNPDVFIPLLRRVHGDCDLTVEGEQRVQQPGSLRELGIATEIDVQNSVDAMRRTMPTFEHRRDVQVKRCAVVLVPDDVRCSRCSEKEIEHTLELRPLGGRAFDVRFLDGSQLPGLELAKVCSACCAVHRYSEVRRSYTRDEQVDAALAGAPLPAGEVREYKPDAAGREFWRFPPDCTVAYETKLLNFSTLADERTQISKQGLQSVMRRIGAPSPQVPARPHVHSCMCALWNLAARGGTRRRMAVA